jgi:hypothetical protein
MTDAHSIKKLKPATTVAMSGTFKDLTTIKCCECGADAFPKHGKWIGGFCVERMVHVCCYCKFLERQKEKGKTVKSVHSDSSDEEKGLVSMIIELIPSARVKEMIRDSSSTTKGPGWLTTTVKDMIRDSSSTTKGPGWLTTTVKDMIRDHTLDEEEVAEIMAGMGFHGRATVAGIDLVGITSISSALTTLIDVMEREGVEGGRESFLVREYWRPNRLVSFKTFATPLLYMGRRERKIAPKQSQDRHCQRQVVPMHTQ